MIRFKREAEIIWRKQQVLLLFFNILSSMFSVVLIYQIIPEKTVEFVSNVYLEIIIFSIFVIAIFVYLSLYNYLVFLNRFRYIYRTTKAIVYVFVFYLIWLAVSSSLYTQDLFSVFILLFMFSFFAYFSRIILLPVILFAPIFVGIDDVDYWAYLEEFTIVYFRWSGRSRTYRYSKRPIDILGAIFAVIIFSPYSKWHKERFSVKQGITSVRQIFGRARLSFDKSSFLDIFYVENRSLCLDFHLLSQTPRTIVFGKGAY